AIYHLYTASADAKCQSRAPPSVRIKGGRHVGRTLAETLGKKDAFRAGRRRGAADRPGLEQRTDGASAASLAAAVLAAQRPDRRASPRVRAELLTHARGLRSPER